MIISKYGIELHRVTRGDIELIRQMRNRDDIRSCMFEQEIITPERQESWFSSINNSKNYYFLIISGREKVGMIYGKNLSFEEHDCEGGIFIWDPHSAGTDVPARASICLTELAFHIFLNERIYARVRADNPRAIHYNKMLGYQPAPEKGLDYMVLTQERFERKAAFLRRIAGEDGASPLSAKDIIIRRSEKDDPLYEGLPREVFALLEPCFSGGASR